MCGAGLGWAHSGPCRINVGHPHLCLRGLEQERALLRGLSAHQMGRVDISICSSLGPIGYTVLDARPEKGDTELEKYLSGKNIC